MTCCRPLRQPSVVAEVCAHIGVVAPRGWGRDSPCRQKTRNLTKRGREHG